MAIFRYNMVRSNIRLMFVETAWHSNLENEFLDHVQTEIEARSMPSGEYQ